jgi:DNA-binding LacI/PurR family transcriptional regulator
MPVPSDRLASVSIRDVASEAGVSHQTVSRVINESPSVKESTRQVVLEAIARLDFRPNRAARALAGGPVQSVTVLTSNTRQYGFASALEGIEEATRAAGFALGVRVVESGTPGDVRDAVERAIEPAGALIVIAYDRAGIAALRAVPPEVPVAAMVETPSGDEAAGKPWVWIDDRRAARDATNYLLGLGHETVHYVSIPSSTNTSQRMLGWRSALEDAGVRVPKPLQAGWDPQSGSQAVQRRLARDPKVTAVLCGNDDLAIGVMRAIHEAGRAIPDDVSVVGFDDTPLSAFYIPALTTVRQDFAALGKACFAKLLSLLDANVSQDAHPWPQAELIVRESAGPPPSPRRQGRDKSGSVPAGPRADARRRRVPDTTTRADAGRKLRSRAKTNQENGERSTKTNLQRT